MSSWSEERQISPVKDYDRLEAMKDQYFFKLNAYHSIFGTMILLQMIAVGLTFFSNQIGISTNNVYVHINAYTADTIISFTFIWAFMMALMLTNRASKNMMTTFVTDKRTNHLANILFIITLSVIGGVTAFLLGFFVKMLIFVIYQAEKQIYFEAMTVGELFIGMTATIFYMLLIAAIGYFIGEVVQIHKSFRILFPIAIVGLIIVFVGNIQDVVTFFTLESSLFIFMGKVIMTVTILFVFATFVGSRLEARRP